MGFSLGGLFSSSSKSKQSSSSNSTTTNQTSSVGDLSSDNTIIHGNYTPNGLAGDELGSVLDFATSIFDKATVQNTTALSTASQLADRASNPTSAAAQDFKPLILWGILGATMAYVLPKVIK